MEPSLEQRVVALLAAHQDFPAEKITPETTLLDDIGMDGDDAVEFFEAFEAEFKPDLTSLYTVWSNHFGSEGWTPYSYGQIAAGVILLAVPAGILGAWAGLPDWVAASGGVAVFLVWFLGLRMWPFKPHTYAQITVRDLVVTAETGRWVVLTT